MNEESFIGQWYDHLWLGVVVLHAILVALALRDIARRAKTAGWRWGTVLVSVWIVLAPLVGPGSYLILRWRARRPYRKQAAG